MRKLAKILIAVLLVTLLTCTLVACDLFGTQSGELPPIIGGDETPDNPTTPETTSKKPVYLTFSYLKQAPSVFKHIYIEEFDLADIEYHVTYEVKVDGKKQYIADEGKPLTMDMLSKDSKKIIETFGDDETTGHYMIFASLKVEYLNEDGETKTKTVEGSFPLHLKTKANVKEFVDFTVDTNGGYALFGDFDAEEGASTIKVEKGYSWTWTEFLADFPAYKEGYAISSVTVDGKTYNASSTDEIKASKNSTLVLGWTADVMPITFDINLPDGVTNWTPEDSSLLENYNQANGTWSVSVVKGEGIIPRPSIANIATLDGYTFAGWATADGSVWNFNRNAGDEPITLYALWTIRTYSVQYVLMGGELDETKGYTDTALASLKLAGIDVKYAIGYSEGDPEYDPNSIRDILAFNPYVITFTGIPYGANLADYYATCKVRSDRENLISISADPNVLQGQLIKNGGCYGVDGWYLDSYYEDENAYGGGKVTEDLILYPKWMVKENLTEEELNTYFAEKLFNYTEKSDGTLRIDTIKDLSVSELVIPTSVKINGKDYVISEIGENAIINVKTLITLDLSEAKSLTKIGKQAFAYCPNLREIIIPEDGLALTYVGEDAFRGTEYINSYAERTGNNFATLGKVLVKYVGDSDVEVIDIDTMSYLLGSVDTIAPGAFSGLANLKTVKIGEGIAYIYDKAFYKNENLVNVNGGAGLVFVAADAFGQTAFITTQPQDKTETAIDESQYLRIGNIYYRYVGTGKSATIPAGVQYIAPNAFAQGSLIETIVFENASEIISVGAEAFAGTKWMSADHTTAETGDANTFVQDGFVVINGILVAKRGRDAMVELPSLVRVIATDALDNSYITNITVPADSNLELIESYAFNGASNLKALTFINATDAVFVEFNDGAFSRKNGEAISDNFKIYLYEEPISTLEKAVSGSDSLAVKSWKELYQSANEMFEVLVTVSVEFNTEIGLPTAYLYDGAEVDFVSVWDSLGLLNSAKTHLKDAVIVVRSDSIARTEDLAISALRSMVGGEAVALDGTIGDKAMTFTLDGITPESLEYSVYPAIKQSTMAVYHEVDGSDVAGMPTFYKTQTNFNEAGHVIKIKFVYNDGNDTEGTILLTDDNVTVKGYRPIIGFNQKLQIEVDYYGLIDYTVLATYTVKEPTSVAISQSSPMVLSINASSADVEKVASKVTFNIDLSDGTHKTVKFDNKATFISVADAEAKLADAEAVEINTTEIGKHYVGLRYGTTDNYVYCIVEYNVILSTDGAQFTYNIVDGKAVITGLKSGYDSTIAVPAKVLLTGAGVYNAETGAEYEVVAIADEAFMGKTDLEYVYIPASVKTIGDRAFMGCSSLLQVRSYTVEEDVYTPSNAFPNVQSIGKESFRDCVKLGANGNEIDFTMATDLMAIGHTAFYGCSSLKALDLSNTQIEEIESSTFRGCSSLESVVLPVSVIAIGDLAFEGCLSLASVEGTVNVQYVGAYVFDNCTSLENVYIPVGVAFDDADYVEDSTEIIDVNGTEYTVVKYVRA